MVFFANYSDTFEATAKSTLEKKSHMNKDDNQDDLDDDLMIKLEHCYSRYNFFLTCEEFSM